MARNNNNLTLNLQSHEIIEEGHQFLVENADNISQFEKESDPVPESIINIPYYHGFLPRKDAIDMILQIGDFLLRRADDLDCIDKERGTYFILLSVKVRDTDSPTDVIHIRIEYNDRDYYNPHQCKEGYSLEEAIDRHMKQLEPLPFFTDEPVLLKNPIERQGWLFHNSDILRVKRVGKGSYGEVWRGLMKLGNSRFLNCAIKVHINAAHLSTEKQCKEFLDESKFNRDLEHENIVKFRGLAIDTVPIMLILEWCENGSLFDYLQNHAIIACILCISFVMEAASGMAYLAKHGIIHRDLAARNCLLDHEFRLKISDFGLSKFGELHCTPTRNHIQRNSAPEVLREGKYYSKTDVWLFGNLMYEIFAAGTCVRIRDDKPPLIPDEDYIKNIRLPGGFGMPVRLIILLKQCFLMNPSERPSFDYIYQNVCFVVQDYNIFGMDQVELDFQHVRLKSGLISLDVSNGTLRFYDSTATMVDSSSEHRARTTSTPKIKYSLSRDRACTTSARMKDHASEPRARFFFFFNSK